MDYSYLKKEIENENTLNQNKFMEVYELQESRLVGIVTDRIKEQITNAIKNYYRGSVNNLIRRPTLFKRYFEYRSTSKDVIVTCPDDWGGPYGNLYIITDYWDSKKPCVHIPKSKLYKFLNLINEKLKHDDIKVKLIYDEHAGWYNIDIIANVGNLD